MRAWRWLERNPSAVLLYVQLGGILLYPFLEGPGDQVGTLVLSLFGMVVLGSRWPPSGPPRRSPG